MKILFIGGLFPPAKKESIFRNCKKYFQFADDSFQWALIKGLKYHLGEIDILTAPLIGTFPFTYKKLFINKNSFYTSDGRKNKSVGYLTIPLINRISKYYALRKSAHKYLKNNEAPSVIMVYAVHTPFLKVAVSIKNRYPNTKICLIVPDLPQYMSSSENWLYIFLKNIDYKILVRLLKKVDCFVLFSELMKDSLPIDSRANVVVEGMIDTKSVDQTNCKKEEEYTILYTGKLDARFGICDLLDAFDRIKDNLKGCHLWICGDGDEREKVKKYAKKDTRIKYWGQVDRDFALELQRRATVVVNPRSPEGEYTKYSFPSKTLEYLLSGTPCIMHHLPAIPPEYDSYLIYTEDNTKEGLKNKLEEVGRMDIHELTRIGERARSFITSCKNPIRQTEKIINMIK